MLQRYSVGQWFGFSLPLPTGHTEYNSLTFFVGVFAFCPLALYKPSVAY